jgi:hypothetical protein
MDIFNTVGIIKAGSWSCAHTFRDDVEKKDGVVSEYPEIL